jgi:hypothetical protein
MLRTTALLTAIALTLVRGHWIVGQIRDLSTAANFRWFLVPAEVANFLFLLPFLALLFILYRSDATVVVSAGLRRTALAAALIQGALFAAPAMYGLLQALRVWHWTQTSDLANQAWSALASLAELAIFSFLLALFLQKDQSQERPSNLLREAAALATITAGLVLILSLAGTVYGAVELRRQTGSRFGEMLGSLVARSLLSMIPRACELIAAYIIFKSQPQRVPDTEPAGEVSAA